MFHDQVISFKKGHKSAFTALNNGFLNFSLGEFLAIWVMDLLVL